MAAKGDLNNGPNPKKLDGNANRVVNDELFVDEWKPSSMTVVKGYLPGGTRIRSSVCDSVRL